MAWRRDHPATGVPAAASGEVRPQAGPGGRERLSPFLAHISPGRGPALGTSRKAMSPRRGHASPDYGVSPRSISSGRRTGLRYGIRRTSIRFRRSVSIRSPTPRLPIVRRPACGRAFQSAALLSGPALVASSHHAPDPIAGNAGGHLRGWHVILLQNHSVTFRRDQYSEGSIIRPG